MIKEFYSYIQEQDDDDVISYSFTTANGSLYYVYFDPYQYLLHVENYPNLLTLGYGFGFQRMYKPQVRWEIDAKISNTISKIILDFIEEQGQEVVLLYHCDYSDKKQRGRDKIFEEWYSKSDFKSQIIKKRIQICHTNKEAEEINLFMGYLTSASNSNHLKIEDEFALFAEALIDK